MHNDPQDKPLSGSRKLDDRTMAPVDSVEHFRVKPRWLFVKLTDGDGLHGWGEATLEGHSRSVEGALDDMRSRIIGLEAE